MACSGCRACQHLHDNATARCRGGVPGSRCPQRPRSVGATPCAGRRGQIGLRVRLWHAAHLQAPPPDGRRLPQVLPASAFAAHRVRRDECGTVPGLQIRAIRSCTPGFKGRWLSIAAPCRRAKACQSRKVQPRIGGNQNGIAVVGPSLPIISREHLIIGLMPHRHQEATPEVEPLTVFGVNKGSVQAEDDLHQHHFRVL